MPTFHLLDAIASLRDLDPFVLIAYPLALGLILWIGIRARVRNRRDEAEAAATERRAVFERAQRDAQIFRSLKGKGRVS